MNLFFEAGIQHGNLALGEEESKHAIQVLRLRQGDPISITDGKGGLYHAVIVDPDPRHCQFTIVQKKSHPVPSFHIHIAISPTKHPDRLEWFVEKSVEAGVHRITPMLCAKTERRSVRIDRLEKVSVSAMKQSLRLFSPEITPVKKFDDVLVSDARQKFIAHVGNDTSVPHLYMSAQPGTTYLVLIGPEGDFTPDELRAAQHNGFLQTSLGDSRLRTETAGILACHTLALRNQQLEDVKYTIHDS